MEGSLLLVLGALYSRVPAGPCILKSSRYRSDSLLNKWRGGWVELMHVADGRGVWLR